MISLDNGRFYGYFVIKITDLPQFGHVCGGEVSFLPVLPAPKPPGFVLFEENINDVTIAEFQFIRPVGPIVDRYHHLEEYI